MLKVLGASSILQKRGVVTSVLKVLGAFIESFRRKKQGKGQRCNIAILSWTCDLEEYLTVFCYCIRKRNSPSPRPNISMNVYYSRLNSNILAQAMHRSPHLIYGGGVCRILHTLNFKNQDTSCIDEPLIINVN